jgi:DNA-binding NtrC family response regulator
MSARSLSRCRGRALVVDDEAIVADFVGELLADESLLVECVLSGAEAAERIAERTYDLVVVDKNLPDMSGLDLLALARTRSPSTRVVIVTAYGSVESALAALQAGAADYILKPIDDVATFLDRLRRALDGPCPDGRVVADLRPEDLPKDLSQAIEMLRARLAAACP